MTSFAASGFLVGTILGSIAVNVLLSRFIIWALKWIRWITLRILLANAFVTFIALGALAKNVLPQGDKEKIVPNLISLATCIILIGFDLIVTRKKLLKARSGTAA